MILYYAGFRTLQSLAGSINRWACGYFRFLTVNFDGTALWNP